MRLSFPVAVVVLAGAGRSFCAGLDLVDQGNLDSIRQVIGEIEEGPRLAMRAQEFASGIVALMRSTPVASKSEVAGARVSSTLSCSAAPACFLVASPADFLSRSPPGSVA